MNEGSIGVEAGAPPPSRRSDVARDSRPPDARTAVVSALIGLLFASPGAAVETTELQAQVQSGQRQSAQSQQRVEALDDRILALRQRYRALQAEAESQEAYNAYLARLVTDQQQEMRSMEKQIGEVKKTRQGIVPLMLRMLDSLEEFVAADLPLLPSERRGRVERLRALMGKADVSEAEKLRRLLEAFQIEGEYGVKMETYRGVLDWQGENRTVNFFHLGRVVFVAQALDRQLNWIWDAHQNGWRPLDAEFSAPITRAIEVADKRATPQLLELPLLSRTSGEKTP